MFASGIPITMFPLNLTNQVTMNSDFIYGLAPEGSASPIYDLAGQLYSMVAFQAGYSFWDTVATAFLDAPTLFSGTQEMALTITTDGPGQGSITEASGGAAVSVPTQVDVDGFYRYLMGVWKGPLTAG